jgi:hypothetical protein
MKKFKLDFDVSEFCEADFSTLAVLKAGDIVFLRPDTTDVSQSGNSTTESLHKSFSVFNSAGSRISSLSRETVQKLPFEEQSLGEHKVVVRSIKKGPGDGSTKCISLRLHNRDTCTEKSKYILLACWLASSSEMFQ